MIQWRWGENVPVHKKFDRPLTPDTARGILLGNAIAKLWAKMIRTEVAPHFAFQSSAQQLGPSPGGGTHFPTQAVKLHMHNATILKKCSAVVFADLKAAFYRTVLEYVLGGLSDAASTEKLSRKLALLHSWHCSSEHQLRKAQSVFFPLGVPPFWARAAADCAAMCAGHPLADLIFCIAFYQYQQAPGSPSGRRPSFSPAQARSVFVGASR